MDMFFATNISVYWSQSNCITRAGFTGAQTEHVQRAFARFNARLSPP